jgi:DNA-binding response OmpR family regulator
MADEILVVEDDTDVQPLLTYTFEKEGYEVTAYDDGEPALSYLEEGARPVCIILDLMMPGIDGLEVLERRKDIEGVEDIPVIVLTGWDADEAVEQAFDRGAEDYITKPFSPNELLMRVQRLLA